MTLTKYQTCKIMSNMTQNDKTLQKIRHRISSYSFRGNYSFLDLEIQRSQYINVRKVFKGGNYMNNQISVISPNQSSFGPNVYQKRANVRLALLPLTLQCKI